MAKAIVLTPPPAFEGTVIPTGGPPVNCSSWRTNGEDASMFGVTLRTCVVSVADLEGIEHAVSVTAETVYEAVALGLAALRQDEWVGGIGDGLTTVRVVAKQPSVLHEINVKDFLSWLGRKSGSPAEVALRSRVEKLLADSRRSQPRR